MELFTNVCGFKHICIYLPINITTNYHEFIYYIVVLNKQRAQ